MWYNWHSNKSVGQQTMAVTYYTVVMYIFINLDWNNITANGIKQLMPMQLTKIQILSLSNIIILT